MVSEARTPQTNKESSFINFSSDVSYIYAVSLSSLSEGPRYTFWNSSTQTTVDYAIAPSDTSDCIRQCFTHEYFPLNNSDHLPISTILSVPTTTSNAPEPPVSQKFDWAKALKSTSLVSYQQEVSSIISPLLGRPYSCTDDLNAEICSVSQRLYSASLKTLPHRTAPQKNNQWFKDQYLFQHLLAEIVGHGSRLWSTWHRCHASTESHTH